MIRLALRRQRGGLIGCALVAAVIGLAQTSAYTSVAGTSALSRQAFGAQMGILGRQLSYLLPLPQRADTVWGYYAWRGVGTLIMLVAIWSVLSASGATRGEEESGLVEEWLSTGLSRGRLLLSRVLAFLTCAAVVLVVAAVMAAVGSLTSHEAVPIAGLAFQTVTVLALGAACYALSILVAQFVVTRGAAGGVAGALIAALFFLNGMSRSVDVGLLRYLSPFHYVDRSNPLVPGGSVDLPATAVLVGIAVVAGAVAVWLFDHRDIGGAALQRTRPATPAVVRPSRLPLLRTPALASFYEQRLGFSAWALAITALGVFLASLLRSTMDIITHTATLRSYIAAFGRGDTGATFIQALWFGLAQLVLTIFVIQQVGRWSDEDQQGRLEILLSVPYPRERVVLERALGLCAQLGVLIAVSSVAVAATAAAGGITYRAGDFLTASAMLLPLGLAFSAVGALLSGVLPRLAVPVLGVLAVGGYLLTELGPLLHAPDWVLRLSFFRLYGTPMTTGVDAAGLATMLAVVVAGFGAGTLLMRRREVGS